VSVTDRPALTMTNADGDASQMEALQNVTETTRLHRSHTLRSAIS
jgi:hypothetical protein